MVDGITVEDIYGGFHTISPMYIESIFMFYVEEEEPSWVGCIRTQSGMNIEVFNIGDEDEAATAYKEVVALFSVVKH